MNRRRSSRVARNLHLGTVAVLAGAVLLSTGCQAIAELVDDARSLGAAEGDTTVDGPDGADHVEEPPPLALPNVDGVDLQTPTADRGPRPELRWDPVDGAERYHVTIVDLDGTVHWAWTTQDTAVVLGGFDTPPDEAARGPQLTEPMRWHVLARDDTGVVIAQSGLRPIAP